jgi:hypothetical protein
MFRYSIPPSSNPEENFVENVLRARHPRLSNTAAYKTVDEWPENGLYTTKNFNHFFPAEIFQNISKKLSLREDNFWNEDVCRELLGRYFYNVILNPANLHGEVCKLSFIFI